MKRIPVDECPAGPEIDAAVMEAQGKIACDRWTPVRYPVPGYIRNCNHSSCYSVGYPIEYSRNIAAAWELVEIEDDQYGVEHIGVYHHYVTSGLWRGFE